MKYKRPSRVVPEGTSRAILLENVMADLVAIKSKEGKKEIVFYKVEDKNLSDSVYEFLLDEDATRQRKILEHMKDDVARECRHFDPIVPGKRKYVSCDYCKKSRDCTSFLAFKRKNEKAKA